MPQGHPAGAGRHEWGEADREDGPFHAGVPGRGIALGRKDMTMMKAALRGLAACTLLAGSAAGVLAQEVTLKMHYFLPPQAIVPKMALAVWADKIEAESDGRIKIQQFPSMQLGGTPPELADQVIDGVADIIWTLPGYTPGRFPATEVFELPFIAAGPEATSKAFWEYSQTYGMDEFEGMKMLALWVHGPGVIHSETPVTSPADLNGMKLRAPSRVTNMYFGELGATPIGMPVPAVPEALSKGVIDATVLPWEVTTSLKISELVNNHTEFPGDHALYVATMFLAMNQGAYDRLPDDLKAVIDANSGMALSAMAGDVMAQGDAIGRQLAVDHGNTLIELTPEQIAPWKAPAAEIEAKWIAEMDAKGLDGAGMVAAAKTLIAKYASE